MGQADSDQALTSDLAATVSALGEGVAREGQNAVLR